MTPDQITAAATELHDLCYRYGRDMELDAQSWSGNRQANLPTVEDIAAILRRHFAPAAERRDKFDAQADEACEAICNNLSKPVEAAELPVVGEQRDDQFIDKIIAQVDQEEVELKMLRKFYNEVGAALANEHAGDIEHLLACAMLGKHTTVIGRKRLEQLHQAETDLSMWQRFASYCRCCAQSGESDPDDFDTFKQRYAAITGQPAHIRAHADQPTAAGGGEGVG